MISNDRAVVNSILVLLCLSSLFMATLMPGSYSVWVLISILFYLAQWVEVGLCQTTKLLWRKGAWDDLELFRKWFYELKKCRPILIFTLTPTKEQTVILKELHDAE